MTLPEGVHGIGPKNGTVRLRTAREGFASSVGHDLVLGFSRWSGEVTVAADLAASTVTAEIELDSIEVLEGVGGVAPLSNDDRTDIRGNALRLLDASHSPVASFRSTRVGPSGEGAAGTLEGDFTLHGTTVPISLDVTSEPGGRWHAKGAVRQSDFGIKPYKAFFGALKLADRVDLEVEVTLDADSGA